MLTWADFIDDCSEEVEQFRVDLRLDLCSLSRKERNFDFCETALTALNSTKVAWWTNERMFQEKYSELIAETIAAIQADFNLSNPNESWTKFKNFYTLQQRAQKRSSCTLKMLDISPAICRKTTVYFQMDINNEWMSLKRFESCEHIFSHLLN